jgi:hypothetical protein
MPPSYVCAISTATPTLLQLIYTFVSVFFYHQTMMDTNAHSFNLFWKTFQMHLKSKDLPSLKLSFVRLKLAYKYMNPANESSDDSCVQYVKKVALF